MAKIGNETTLILKLAKERMQKKLEFKERNTYEIGKDFLIGYKAGCTEYTEVLLEIVNELERK